MLICGTELSVHGDGLFCFSPSCTFSKVIWWLETGLGRCIYTSGISRCYEAGLPPAPRAHRQAFANMPPMSAGHTLTDLRLASQWDTNIKTRTVLYGMPAASAPQSLRGPTEGWDGAPQTLAVPGKQLTPERDMSQCILMLGLQTFNEKGRKSTLKASYRSIRLSQWQTQMWSGEAEAVNWLRRQQDK